MAIVLAVKPQGLLGKPPGARRRPPRCRSSASSARAVATRCVHRGRPPRRRRCAAARGRRIRGRARDRHPRRGAVRRQPAVPDRHRRHDVVRPCRVLRRRRVCGGDRLQGGGADAARIRARARRRRLSRPSSSDGSACGLSGVYLAMLTLAFAQIVWSIAFQWDAVTGGSNGLVGIWPPELLTDAHALLRVHARGRRACACRASWRSRDRRSASRCAVRATRALRAAALGIDVRAHAVARLRARGHVRRARRRSLRVLQGQHLAGDARDPALGRRARDGAAGRTQRAVRSAARRGGVHVARRTRSRAPRNTGARCSARSSCSSCSHSRWGSAARSRDWRGDDRQRCGARRTASAQGLRRRARGRRRLVCGGRRRARRADRTQRRRQDDVLQPASTASSSPTRGTVALEDARIDGLPPHAIARSGVGRTFQVAATFASMTVRENVVVAPAARMATRARDGARDALLAACRVRGPRRHAVRGRLPTATRSGSSSRSRWRAAPRLLLMDEPTAGMAPRSRARADAGGRDLAQAGRHRGAVHRARHGRRVRRSPTA